MMRQLIRNIGGWVMEYIGGLIVVALIAIVVILPLIACYEKPQTTVALYHAWCRVNPTIEIGIGEWQALRNNHLLPGQSTKEQ